MTTPQTESAQRLIARQKWFRDCPIPTIDRSNDGSFASSPDHFTLEQLLTYAERESRHSPFTHMFVVRALHLLASDQSDLARLAACESEE